MTASRRTGTTDWHTSARRCRRVATIVALAVMATACSDEEPDAGPATGSLDTPSSDGGGEITVPDGFEVSVLADGFEGPTQIADGGDGSLVVAQLNGGESDASGQVLRVPVADPDERVVLFDNLAKPTGVVQVGDEVWVMEQRRLSRGPTTGGELVVEQDDLPFNGRSEGTLSVDPDERVLYDTSGSIDGTEAAAGSGALWAIESGGEPQRIASGFKHAYARTYDADGTLWETELSDGSYDGEPAPDELVAVAEGDDFGWPQCIGDGTPVELYGGTVERCESAPPSHALFEPGATPTSVAVAPWDPDVLLVALWNQGEVVAIDRTATELPVEPTTFLTGIDNPQHLLVLGDRLLLTDFSGGSILEISATG